MGKVKCAFFCLKKLPSFGKHTPLYFLKAPLILNFHKILPNDDLSVEMSFCSIYPHLICQ